ncbi:MAG: response regulator transcription factor [Bacteroidia bacterium]|nr:response regulator transcription factor [Bacteroidia bacterium]
METSLKIGLVDDHPLFRQGIEMMISSNTDMKVVLQASNGAELLELLERGGEADVILLDLEMPEMDGMETCGKVKALYPEIKILILTMHEDAPLIQHMMKQGANGYVLKSAKWEELQKALLEVAEKDFYFSDLVGLAMLSNLTGNSKPDPSLSTAPKLSRREREVLEEIIKGKSSQEIADSLFISLRTVEGHRSSLLQILGVKNTAGMIVKALKLNLISLSEI